MVIRPRAVVIGDYTLGGGDWTLGVVIGDCPTGLW